MEVMELSLLSLRTYNINLERSVSFTKFPKFSCTYFWLTVIVSPALSDALKEEDFKRILKEPDNSLIKQYKELLKTENVDLEFTEDGIDMLAKISAEVNSSVENIGARRLHTIIEKVLDDISFNATDRAGETITVNQKYVQDNLGNLVKDTDLSKFIL